MLRPACREDVSYVKGRVMGQKHPDHGAASHGAGTGNAKRFFCLESQRHERKQKASQC